MRKMKFDTEWRQAIGLLSHEAGKELEALILDYQTNGAEPTSFRHPEAHALFIVIRPQIDRRRRAAERNRLYRKRPQPESWIKNVYPELAGNWRYATRDQWLRFTNRMFNSVKYKTFKPDPDLHPYVYYLLFDILPKSRYNDIRPDLDHIRGDYVDYLHPHGL